MMRTYLVGQIANLKSLTLLLCDIELMLDVNDACCSKIADSFYQSAPTLGSFEIFRAKVRHSFRCALYNYTSIGFCHKLHWFQCCVSTSLFAFTL